MIQTDSEKKKQEQMYGQGGDYDAQAEMNRLGQAISGRRAFSYNPNSDPMYRSYARQYQLNGRMAMKDSMGQAAALTGGYGSSYGAAVGQQQYDEYLRRLSEELPELYEFAYQRQQDALAEQQRQEQQAYARRQDSYNSLVKLISGAGYTPTDAELSQAGMTRAQADALKNRYLLENGLLPGTGGGGGGGYSSGSSKNKTATTGKTVVKPGAKSSSSTSSKSGSIASTAIRNPKGMVSRPVRI